MEVALLEYIRRLIFQKITAFRASAARKSNLILG